MVKENEPRLSYHGRKTARRRAIDGQENEPRLSTTRGKQRNPPVRVKLRKITASLSKNYPPDGQGKIWWARLKKALGTTSSDFVNASLIQLQTAAQLHCGGISEIAVNAALAMIEAAAPQNEIEASIAIQMACTHSAAMSVLARFGSGGGSERRVVALASAAARLMRAHSGHVETLRRLRHGGDQYVRVEHVHIGEGGQAVIGNVKTQDHQGPLPPGRATPEDTPIEHEEIACPPECQETGNSE
jgi:hypothetical protein